MKGTGVLRPASALVRRRVFAAQTPLSRAFTKQSLEDDGCAREGGLFYYWRCCGCCGRFRRCMHRLLTRLAPNHHVHHRHRTPPGWISPLLRNFLPPPKPGTLILVRHGESEWNSEKKFTGWTDVDLNARGKREVEHAARLLLERGYTVDGAWCGVVLF